MPVHIGFSGLAMTAKAAVITKVKEITGQKFSHGWSLKDFYEFYKEINKQRECKVTSYPDFRGVLEFWNPGRWTDGAKSNGAKPGLLGWQRGGSRGGAGAYAGEIRSNPSGKMVPDRVNTKPVSQTEWDLYLAPGTANDSGIRGLFDLYPRAEVMFIRFPLGQHTSLKRIEYRTGPKWEILWSNASAD